MEERESKKSLMNFEATLLIGPAPGISAGFRLRGHQGRDSGRHRGLSGRCREWEEPVSWVRILKSPPPGRLPSAECRWARTLLQVAIGFPRKEDHTWLTVPVCQTGSRGPARALRVVPSRVPSPDRPHRRHRPERQSPALWSPQHSPAPLRTATALPTTAHDEGLRLPFGRGEDCGLERWGNLCRVGVSQGRGAGAHWG